jgi:N-acylneuraminate cytidylyltransferase
MENNLAIIPARGGSKRIPGKNLKPFLGKPIIAYSIDLAKESRLFDEIMVSTDDAETVELAKSYGASIPFIRSKENSGDFATLNDVLLEVIAEYQKSGRDFNFICMLLPTAPLIKKNTLFNAFDLLKSSHFDSVRPIVRFSYPVQRSVKLTGNKIEMFYPEHLRSRSQDFEPAYHDAGQFYWLNKGKNLADSNKGALVIPETEAQDIDNEDDWKLAELKYKLFH